MRVSGKMIKGLIAAASFAIAVSVAGPVAAEPVFDVSAGFSAGWRSDSNFYYDASDPAEVYTYSVSPKFSVGKETANMEFGLDYEMTINYYRDQDSLSPGQRDASDKDYISNDVKGRVLYKPIDSLSLGLDVAYQNTLDPQVTDELIHDTDDNEYFVARFSPVLNYQFGREGRLNYSMRYRNSDIEYSNGAEEGSAEHKGIFKLGYELTATTNVGLEYQVAKMEYDKTTSDYTDNQVKLRAGYEFGLLTIEAGAGVKDRSFEDAGVKNVDTGVYDFKLALEGAQAKIVLGSQFNYNSRGTNNDYYEAHKFTIDMEYVYADRLPLALGGHYQISDYLDTQVITNTGATEIRQDRIYDVHGSVGYKITEWITFKVAAGYEDKQTNAAGFDYDNTYCLGSIEFNLYPR